MRHSSLDEAQRTGEDLTQIFYETLDCVKGSKSALLEANADQIVANCINSSFQLNDVAANLKLLHVMSELSRDTVQKQSRAVTELHHFLKSAPIEDANLKLHLDAFFCQIYLQLFEGFYDDGEGHDWLHAVTSERIKSFCQLNLQTIPLVHLDLVVRLTCRLSQAFKDVMLVASVLPRCIE